MVILKVSSSELVALRVMEVGKLWEKSFGGLIVFRRKENCGFGGKNKTQNFQKVFSGDIFLYLLNILANAASKLKQKMSKIIV